MGRLLQAWIHNTFDYSEDPHGYATYFFPSFMSHSCLPNAFWHYGDRDIYVLRARQDIAPGDEVCVSYLDETILLGHAIERRWDLWESKQFWCTCERCVKGTDFSRGLTCPTCSSATVFANLPGSGVAMEQEDNSLKDELWLATRCVSCGHAVSEEEAKRLNEIELELTELLGSWEGKALQDRDVKSARLLIQQSFPQHSLAEKVLEEASKFFRAYRRYPELLEIFELRSKFAEAAYPGLSAAYAWLMESHADALRTAAKLQPDTASGRL